MFNGNNFTVTVGEKVGLMITVDLGSLSSDEELGQLGLCPGRILRNRNYSELEMPFQQM